MKQIICNNKSAHYDYNIIQTFQVGISLLGSEVKTCRTNNGVQLKGSYIMIDKGQLLLIGCNISPYTFSNGYFSHQPNRTRILLAKKSEILKMYQSIKEKGITIIPLSIYWINNYIKLDIGLCKGKNKADKRQALKEKQFKKEWEYR